MKDMSLEDVVMFAQKMSELVSNFDVKTIEQEKEVIQQDGDNYFSAEDIHYYQEMWQNERPSKMSGSSKIQKNDKKIRWRQGKLLGSGSFGCVMQGMNIDTGELMAVKSIKLNERDSIKK